MTSQRHKKAKDKNFRKRQRVRADKMKQGRGLYSQQLSDSEDVTADTRSVEDINNDVL